MIPASSGFRFRLAMIGIVAWVVSTTWIALLLAGLGHFSAWPPLVAGGLVAGLFIRFTRDRSSSPLQWQDGLAIILAFSTLILTLPAGELILGGWDPGVYLHTGKQVAEQGSLQFDHPDLAAMPDPERRLLSRNPDLVVEPFSGVRVMENGRLTPQFYHAYPSMLALFISLAGLSGGLAANAIINIFCVLAFYALAAVFFRNRSWALLAALLLALTPSQIWMAKFSTAELLTQFLLVSGFALLFRWHEEPQTRNTEALLGGMALGLAQLTRYDTLIVLAAALPVLLWTTRDRVHRRGLVLALGAIGIAIVHAWAHQRWIAPYYRPLGPMVGKALSLCVIVTVLGLLVRAIHPFTRHAPMIRTVFLAVVSAGWVAWMSLNWLLRPTLHLRTNLAAKIETCLSVLNLDFLMPTLIGPPSRAMLYLESIFGAPGLLLGLAGILAILWRNKSGALHAWLWGGMTVTFVLTWHPLNDLFMMWVSRRYVPIVIPWLIIGMVAGGTWAWGLLRMRFPGNPRLAAVVPICLLLALSVQIPSSLFLARERDWPGLVTWFENVHAHLPPDALVYTDQPGFGAPLRFLWGHRAYELRRPDDARRERLLRVMARTAGQNGSVYFLTAKPLPAVMPEHIDITVHAELPLKSHIIKGERTAIPRHLNPRGGDFKLYAIRGTPE